MLIEKIRAATSVEHKKLEAALFPFINTIADKMDYILLLQAFYGYIAPVQQLIVKHIDDQLAPDMDQRRNASLLLDDLASLGVHTQPETATQLPVIDSNASAFGALYVLEGSTLGGKIISKMIAEKLGSDEALRFFKGYGAEMGKMWKIFTQQLEADKNQEHAETVIKAATDTFALFGTWLEKNIPAKHD